MGLRSYGERGRYHGEGVRGRRGEGQNGKAVWWGWWGRGQGRRGQGATRGPSPLWPLVLGSVCGAAFMIILINTLTIDCRLRFHLYVNFVPDVHSIAIQGADVFQFLSRNCSRRGALIWA